MVTRERPNVASEEFECREWGFTVAEITEERAQALRLPDRKGVIVSGVKSDSFADEGGVRRFDIITTLEGREVTDLTRYREIYREMVDERRTKILIQTRRGRLTTFHVLKPLYDRRPGGVAS
jgi:serine protease Do